MATDPNTGALNDVVLLNAFLIKGKRCRVYLHRGVLVWETERRPYKRNSLLLSDVLAVHPVHLNVTDSARPCCGELEGKEGLSSAMHQAFTIHYADVGTKNRLRHRLVTLKHSDHRQVSSWIKTLKAYLKSQTARPKRLIVFVNPYGGKKRGLQIFKKQMEPLLQVADVNCTMVLTEAPNHAYNMLVSIPNLVETYDGVACVGGDGTFSEVVNGLVARTFMDAGLDQEDACVEVPKPKISIGVVPGGSTDTVAFCMHGTNDVQTAILHIILGDKRGMDLCGLRTNEKHVRYAASVISYGYLGDVMKDSENHRWMGPRRYDYSGFKKFFGNRGYDGELKVKLKLSPSHQNDPSKGQKCQINCPECSLLNENFAEPADTNDDEWNSVTGKFFMVSGANLSCSCPRSPNGIAPYCHSGNGCADVVLVRHTNIFNNLRLLLRLSSSRKTLFDLPFVEVYRAQEFRFTAAKEKKTSCWNCDGELVFASDLQVKVHRQLVSIFTKGAESSRRSTNAPASNCWC